MVTASFIGGLIGGQPAVAYSSRVYKNDLLTRHNELISIVRQTSLC